MNKEKVKKILYDIFIKYQVLFIILIFLDQLTKRLAVKYLDGNTIEIFSWLQLKLQINSGVAFSFLASAPQWVSAMISIVATLGIEYYLVIKKGTDKPFNILLLIIAAGALGNGIDRWLSVFGDKTGYSGVIDFIFPTFFANFNVADIYVTLGCIALILYLFSSPDEDGLSRKERKALRAKIEAEMAAEEAEKEELTSEEANNE